jgi:hypothetical protein
MIQLAARLSVKGVVPSLSFHFNGESLQHWTSHRWRSDIALLPSHHSGRARNFSRRSISNSIDAGFAIQVAIQMPWPLPWPEEEEEATARPEGGGSARRRKKK